MADRYVPDPQARWFLENAASTDPNQPYYSPESRRFVDRTTRTSPGAATGVGALTPGASSPTGGGPAIDRGSVRVPGSELANIMRVIADLRAAGELHLADEITRAAIQLGASDALAVLGPRGGYGPGNELDWGDYGEAAGRRDSYGVDRRGLTSFDADHRESELMGAIHRLQDANSRMRHNNWLVAADRAGARTDAGTDAGRDAGRDAGTDAGTDAAHDAGADAGSDWSQEIPMADDRTLIVTEDGWYLVDEFELPLTPSEVDAATWADAARLAEQALADHHAEDSPEKEPGNPDAGGTGSAALAARLLPSSLVAGHARPAPSTDSGPGANYGPDGQPIGTGPGFRVGGLADDPGRRVTSTRLRQAAQTAARIRRGLGPGIDPGRPT